MSEANRTLGTLLDLLQSASNLPGPVTITVVNCEVWTSVWLEAAFLRALIMPSVESETMALAGCRDILGAYLEYHLCTRKIPTVILNSLLLISFLFDDIAINVDVLFAYA
ncbi:hypothetical protein Pint_08557 [Pistacia integerrima]|uniref:Uncharacterized protein n=1 Tax=Pistacia integerrima TaxID=434235 RepID=A0ACC0XWU3_9ROSI|nr:hypothetical protein Pint_08557 [Pistacia integerrima]